MVVFPGFRKPLLSGQNGIRSKAASVPPVSKPSALPSMKAPANRTVDPRAPIAVPTTVAAPSGKHVTDVTKTLSASSTVSSSAEQLPTLGDIINMRLNTTVTFDAGATVSGSVQATTSIDHVEIFNNAGRIIMTITSEQFHMLFADYSPHKTDLSDPSTTVVASTNSQTATTYIQMPYVSLPASAGPYSVVIYFAGYSNLGSWASDNGPTLTKATGISSASVTCGIDVSFGDAGGLESNLVSTNVAVASGSNSLQNKVPFQNQSLAELILYGFAADSDLSYISVDVNGAAIVGNLSEGSIAGEDASIIQATRPKGLFWLSPALGTQIALNTSSTFDVYLASGATTTSITALAYRLSPPS